MERKVYQLVKRRVCYYCIATHLGGAERSLLDLLHELKGNPALELKVLLPRATGPLLERLEAEGIKYHVVELPSRFLSTSRSAPRLAVAQLLGALPSLALYLFRARRYVQREQIEIIHTTGIKCHFLSVILAAGTKIKIVWHLRDIFPQGATRILLRAFYRLASNRVSVIANSLATAQSFSKDDPPRVIHNGLNLDTYYPKGSGPSTKIPTVAIIGVLARWKGQIEFLKMAHALERRGISARYLVVGAQIYDTVGDQGYSLELERFAHTLGIAKQVRFLGFQKDIPSVLAGVDVLVHASTKPEPFGRVLIEAQACGVPVVASAGGGVLEIVQDGETGLLFPPGNVQAMADQVERLLENPQLAAKLAQAAQQRVRERFCLESHARSVLEVYRQEGSCT